MTSTSIEPDRELLADTDRSHGKVTELLTVSVRRFESGHAHAHVSHMDTGNRQMVPGPHWCLVESQPTRDDLLRWCVRIALATAEEEHDNPPLPWS